MNTDPLIRLLLSGILVCLLLLVVQGFAGGGDSGRTGWGRYHVTGMRAGAPVLIRTDTVTGEVWKLELRGGGDRWRPFLEPGGAEPAQVAREPADEGASQEREIIEPPGGLAAARAELEAARADLESLGLEQPRSDEEVQNLVDALATPELPKEIRAWAAGQLGEIDAPAATEALIAALQDPDPSVAVTAVRSLGAKVSEPDARSALESARSHANSRVRNAAERALEPAP